MHIQQLDVPACVLGEGPVWSDREGCLYYVDIPSFRLNQYWPSNKRHRSWTFDTDLGAVVECRSGGLMLALGDRLAWFDPEKGLGSLRDFAVLERDRPQNRLNDSKADPWGRFWVGAARRDESAADARLWCVLPDGQAKVVREGIVCSNSIAFDRERQRMYFADSPTGQIDVAELDDAHELGAFRPFAKAGRGAPDGSCTDADGYLWNAEWGGKRICRYAPDGSLERVLEMPVGRPSCCAFGGERHRTLFVTSAKVGMTEQELLQDPNAGALFSIELDVEGLPADMFDL